MPAFLLLLNKDIKKNNETKEDKNIKKKNRYKKYAKFLISNDKKIVLFTSSLFIMFQLGLFQVKVDSNTIRYFDKNVEIRKSTEFTMDNLTGPMSYEIVIDSKEKDGIKEPEFLKTVQRFYNEYQSKYNDVRHLASLLDVVKQFNKVMNGDKEEFYTVPKTKEMIAQYLLLYTMSLPQGMEINDKMDIEERLLRVTGQINLVDTSKDLEMIRWAEDWWKDTQYSARIDGQTAMFAYMQSSVTDTLIYSMSIAMTLVSLIMLIIFKNIKILAIFILPNILPIILVVGVMGLAGIYLDMGVAISAAIILGIAVDDTIHFFNKYLDHRKQGYNVEESIEYVMHYTGGAIILSTVVLSLSFAVLAFSSFNPNVYFALTTVTALLIALVGNLLLLPAIFSIKDKK